MPATTKEAGFEEKIQLAEGAGFFVAKTLDFESLIEVLKELGSMDQL